MACAGSSAALASRVSALGTGGSGAVDVALPARRGGAEGALGIGLAERPEQAHVVAVVVQVGEVAAPGAPGREQPVVAPREPESWSAEWRSSVTAPRSARSRARAMAVADTRDSPGPRSSTAAAPHGLRMVTMKPLRAAPFQGLAPDRNARRTRAPAPGTGRRRPCSARRRGRRARRRPPAHRGRPLEAGVAAQAWACAIRRATRPWAIAEVPGRMAAGSSAMS